MNSVDIVSDITIQKTAGLNQSGKEIGSNSFNPSKHNNSLFHEQFEENITPIFYNPDKKTYVE